jgi:hypothetical protein
MESTCSFFGGPSEKVAPEGNVDWWVTPLDGGPAVGTGALDATRRENLQGPILAYPWILTSPVWDPARDSLIFPARQRDSTNLWRVGISRKTWKLTGPPQRLTSGPTLEESPSVVTGSNGISRLHSQAWPITLTFGACLSTLTRES